ncbi:MAG: UDP-N-acetylmuramate dehydrogenase [Flavobacteriales bacterium]|jgi:UDP-N-acetylmuramate dehydrogenase|nr:UDP-N-acetylmuramate dehydrogenase [Flavobacteriales bacterium]
MSNILHNYSLKNHNTFGIAVKAKYFSTFNSILELKKILKTNLHQEEKFFILGSGSNILLTQDFDGFILHNKIEGICILEDNENYVLVEVGGGVEWHDFVMWSVSQELSGVENLALIPGTVGASPVQNIGAYGMEVKDSITKVHTLEIKNKEVRIFSNKDCEFSYRNSTFKKDKEKKFIITKVEFKLSKEPLNKTTYGAIKEELKNLKLKANPGAIAEAVIKIRNRKLPNPKVLGNSGSFFKNPVIETTKFEALKKEFPEMVGYTISNSQTKIAAGWLIENAGLKGYRKADAGVHKNQALVLVNYGNASGTEIINLAKEIQQKVKDKYGISIEPEVSIL